MAVRTRALVGKAADGHSPHWSESMGKQRLLEVMGRMDPDGGNRELQEKLFLHGLGSAD